MQVKAAIAPCAGQPMVIDTIELDDPRADEVLIRFQSAGLCHTDQMFIDGTRAWSDYPIVLGHEGAGTVISVGAAVTRLAPGDKVIPLALPECGKCPACLNPLTNLCDETFRPFDRLPFRFRGSAIPALNGIGSFAEFAVVREMQVARIRDDAPLADICCLGCAGITGIGAVTHTARVRPGSSVTIFGLGGIGLNVVDGARIAGATRIIGIDRNPAKEGPARAAGLTHFLNAGDLGAGIPAAIADITGGGADYAFECIGNAAVLQQAIDCTRPGWGMTVAIGVMPGANTDTIPIQPRSFRIGKTVTGSALGNIKPLSEFPRLVDWHVEGLLRTNALVSHRLPLERINEGFDLLRQGQAMRVVIDF